MPYKYPSRHELALRAPKSGMQGQIPPNLPDSANFVLPPSLMSVIEEAEKTANKPKLKK